MHISTSKSTTAAALSRNCSNGTRLRAPRPRKGECLISCPSWAIPEFQMRNDRKTGRRLVIDFKFHGFGAGNRRNRRRIGHCKLFAQAPQSHLQAARKSPQGGTIRVPGSTLIWTRDLSHLELAYEARRWNLPGTEADSGGTSSYRRKSGSSDS